MQSLFKSALILDYSMCMIWTLKKERKKRTQVRCSAPNSGLRASMGRSHPLPPATSFKVRLRPRLKWQPPEVTPFGKRHESWMTWRTGSTPGLHKC